MTDAQMIKRAAKGAGIELDEWIVWLDGGGKLEALRVRGSPFGTFDPYASNEDAFLVMIGAGLKVQATETVIAVEGPNVLHRYIYKGDRAEATRRAIVDVAAWCA